MARTRRTPSKPKAGLSSDRELIVVVNSEANLHATPGEITSAAGADVSSLSQLLTASKATLRPLFGASEERVHLKASALGEEPGVEVPNLSLYYHVEAPDEALNGLAKSLRRHAVVEAAYVKPSSEPPQGVNDMAPAPAEPPAATPDFTPRQGYLEQAPEGVDARYAWTIPGGRGAGVSIIDCEWGWRFTHEDLIQSQGGVVAGVNSSDDNHGTAVLGEFSGDRNSFGITGISPDAFVRGVAFSLPTATAIRTAADQLQAGDIILLEIHRPGPRFNFASRSDQRGYIAIEWWPDDFDAIRYATSRGVIVVEAGGNGAESLDDALYSTRPTGFPANWSNPFNRANRDSGAIVVGAGAPPPGTHGRDWGPDRSRLDFSNYGAVVDAQGWGREVTSTGYGDLQGGTSRDLWYTDMFSGTSSASPIVVGTVACLQGILRARGGLALTPARARELLRGTGSPQQDTTGRPRTQRIGNRPDLRQLVSRAAGTGAYEQEIRPGTTGMVALPPAQGAGIVGFGRVFLSLASEFGGAQVRLAIGRDPNFRVEDQLTVPRGRRIVREIQRGDEVASIVNYSGEPVTALVEYQGA